MGILDLLDDGDLALLVEVLSREAPDLLTTLEPGVTLTPGSRPARPSPRWVCDI